MPKKIVISSSMRFRSIIKDTMAHLAALGFEPVFPNIDYTAATNNVVQSMEDQARLAWDHYRAIDEADCVYFILANGYMGTSCKLELGYALARGKPVFFSEMTNDGSLDVYPKAIVPLNNLALFISLL